jgi:hypothetical protein
LHEWNILQFFKKYVDTTCKILQVPKIVVGADSISSAAGTVLMVPSPGSQLIQNKQIQKKRHLKEWRTIAENLQILVFQES